MLDITQRKATEAKLEHLAYHDPLTGLVNRRLLLNRLQHAMVSNTRSNRFGAILFLDLDNFKRLMIPADMVKAI
jgi:GGDEF domain-containing protein